MASNYTENYGLCQWEATDQVLREEFNQDNQKIDAALSGMPKVVAGIYTGDGTASRIIPLGFTPKAVFVWNSNGEMYYSNGSIQQYWGGLALPGVPCITSSKRTYLAIEEQGFQVYYAYYESSKLYIQTNLSGSKYLYLAIG